MKLEYWLKRQRLDLENFIKSKNFKSYEELVEYSAAVRLHPPSELEVKKYFKKTQIENVPQKVEAKDSTDNAKATEDKHKNKRVRTSTRKRKNTSTRKSRKTASSESNSSRE